MPKELFPTTQSFPEGNYNKTKWPWTAPKHPYPENLENSEWPRISIVTPSFNQGQFIEETIRSVLLQGYPNLEYIIIDGGSTDNSVEIIKKYNPWLTYWISEKDKGQSHAINKGFQKATGEIYGWLNSDDFLLPSALLKIKELYKNYPNHIAWSGGCYAIDISGNRLHTFLPRIGNKSQFADWWHKAYISQPGCFFCSETFRKVGGLNEKLNFVIDVELWMRFTEIGQFATTDHIIAATRVYPEAKTYRDPVMREIEHIFINIELDEKEAARTRLLRYVINFADQNAMAVIEKHFPWIPVKNILRLTIKAFYEKIKRLLESSVQKITK